MCFLYLHFGDDFSAFAQAADNLQSAADLLGPFAHADQTEAAAVLSIRRIGGKAAAVIADLDQLEPAGKEPGHMTSRPWTAKLQQKLAG